VTEVLSDLRYFRAWVSYDGTDFCGFQDQLGQESIQSALTQAIGSICNSPFKLKGAGRTDAGVHARAQAVSIEMATTLNTEKLVLALSHTLPKSIRVFRVDEFPRPFDPQKHAMGKRYVYRIWNGLASDPFRDRFMWHLRRQIDVARMVQAAPSLIGELDYESFRSAQCSASHARRTVWAVNISKTGHEICIEVRGNAFCHNMVRIIAGTLVEVGIGKKQPEDMATILIAKDRRKAGITAPAKGLTLEEIYYPDDLDSAEIPSHANFPRYPVTEQSWPFKKNEVAIGSSIIR
jgi:tRNA pseudouridine38-40 synthase